MKNLYGAAPLCCLLFIAFASFAQGEPPLNQQPSEKPFLFSNLPDKFECNVQELQKLFVEPRPDYVSAKFHEVFYAKGLATRNVSPKSNLTSINIHLDNYKGALLNLSQIFNDKGISYTGRIVSMNHADVLLLKEEKGQYFFVKQERKFVMVE